MYKVFNVNFYRQSLSSTPLFREDAYKCYFSFRSRGITMGRMHIDLHPGSFGVTKNDIIPFYGMIMWLMIFNQLDLYYKSYESKKSSGIIWGHMDHVIFTKNVVTRVDQ